MGEVGMAADEVAQGVAAIGRIEKAVRAEAPIRGGLSVRIAWTSENSRCLEFVGSSGEMKPGVDRESVAGSAAIRWQDSPRVFIPVRASPKVQANSDLAQIVDADEPVRAGFVAGQQRQREQGEERDATQD